MAQKKTKLLPWILLAGAGAAAYYYFKKPSAPMEPMILPPADSTPQPPSTTTPTAPVTSTPPIIATPKPIQIGKAAKIKNGQQTVGFITAAMGTPYPRGGVDNFGSLKSDNYAGTVQEVNTQMQSARVQNFTYPMKDAQGNISYSYWLPVNKLEGSYI